MKILFNVSTVVLIVHLVFFNPPTHTFAISSTKDTSLSSDQPLISDSTDTQTPDPDGHLDSVTTEDEISEAIPSTSEQEDTLPPTDIPSQETIPKAEDPLLVNDSTAEDKNENDASMENEEVTPVPSAKPAQQSPIGVALLQNVTLAGSYDNTKKVTLDLTGTGMIDPSFYQNQLIIFQMPSELMPFIDRSSFQGTYDVPGIATARKTGTIANSEWIIDTELNQIRFNSNKLLNTALLSSTYKFRLQFILNRLPLTAPQNHLFTANFTDSAIDIKALITQSNQWTLSVPDQNSPLFFLEVPTDISFGTIGIQPRMGKIYRDTPMSIKIFHQNAIGYPFQLTARATPLQSSDQVLKDAVYFTRSDQTSVLLNDSAQTIASGTMPTDALILTYSPKQGLFFDITNQMPQPGLFSTTIEWTLVDSIQ